ncbi:MAG TPA: alpha/beta hydrolase [Pyrinomonadaceae bacterium]|jgi:pimeloyl-ACP methyl ester carboxylesterase
MSNELINLDSSIRQGYAQVGGVRLHYAQSGSGERLVLLLHGFPEFWYSWRHQLKALGDRYTVVAPDLRGYNLSDKPERVADYRMPLLIDDVTGLIRHFGARQAAVVGHDWGAGLAWAVAQKHPEYVWKLAALQVPPMSVWRANLTLKQALLSWYMLFFQLPRVPEWLISLNDFAAIERMFRKTVARPGTVTEADIKIYKDALRVPNALTAGINYYRANVGNLFLRGRSTEATEDLSDGRVRVPTLFIYGEQDHAVLPETVRNIDSFIDAPYREIRIKTSGHWVQQEAHAEVSAALGSFLDND